jgi:hypothetical protein
MPAFASVFNPGIEPVFPGLTFPILGNFLSKLGLSIIAKIAQFLSRNIVNVDILSVILSKYK